VLPRDDVQAGGGGGEEKNLLFLSGIELRFSGWASQSDLYIYIYIYKGKAAPLQAWSGPEGSSKLRFPDLMTTAQDSSKIVSLTHWPPLTPGNTPGTHFC